MSVQFPKRASLTVAVVVAHPDDESFCSGTIALLVSSGVQVHLVYVTSGEGARSTDQYRLGDESRIDVREREARAAGAILGVDAIEFLRIADPEPQGGRLQVGAQPLEIAESLRGSRALSGAHFIVTHGSNGEYGHPCHVAVRAAVLSAVTTLESADAVFSFAAMDLRIASMFQINSSDSADYVINVAKLANVRQRALLAHASQVRHFTGGQTKSDEATEKAVATLIAGRQIETFSLAWCRSGHRFSMTLPIFRDAKASRVRKILNGLVVRAGPRVRRVLTAVNRMESHARSRLHA